MPKLMSDEDLMEDSDLPSDPDDDTDPLSEGESGDETLPMVEGSDNEDLISLDGDLPKGVIDSDGTDEDDQWAGISAGDDKKRKRTEGGSGQRKKLRTLPVFASYEGYAKMIEDASQDEF